MCSDQTTLATDYLDVLFKLATISIALFNAYFAVRVFNTKDKKENLDKEKDRRIQLLKTIILDHNLKNLYSIFDSLRKELEKLRVEDLKDEVKIEINSNIEDSFISLRRNFYDQLVAVDINMYTDVKLKADELQSHISGAIFDSGIVLNHSPKFDEVITEKITDTHTSILKLLFDYRG